MFTGVTSSEGMVLDNVSGSKKVAISPGLPKP